MVLFLAACEMATCWRAPTPSVQHASPRRALARRQTWTRGAMWTRGARVTLNLPKVSAKAARFEAMLERCRQYTAFELAALREQPRMQRLLTGVIAGARDVDVVRAFTVLYEDFLPLRLGGDLIFNILDDRLQAAVAARNAAILRGEHDGEVCAVEPTSTQCEEETQLSAAKALFDLVDSDGSGELSRDEVRRQGAIVLNLERVSTPLACARAHSAQNASAHFPAFQYPPCVHECNERLMVAQVIGSGFHELLKQYYGLSEIDELFAAAEPADGAAAQHDLTFEQFVRASRAVGALPDAENLRLELLRNRDSREPGSSSSRRRANSDKYDAMLETFAGWTANGEEQALLAAVGNERLRAVLQGCFAGARNRQVVLALKILYEDHAPLRMGGDLIFGLMLRVVQGAKKESSGAGRRA